MWVEEWMPWHTFTQHTSLPDHEKTASNYKARTQSITPMSQADRKEFAHFKERNSGTVVAVRQTSAVHKMMRLALEIYPKMLAKGWIHGNWGIADQGAFREAYFVHRNEITEKLLPLKQGCHQPGECGDYPSCLFVNGRE
jgi:hypothetical protein